MLLERAKRFEEDALAEIFNRHNAGIFRYALRQLGETELARECMAETFSRFLNVLRRGTGPQDYLQAYLYRIAHNWITDFYRAGWRQMDTLDEEMKDQDTGHPTLILDERFRQECLRKALAKLTTEQRQVIVLKFLEDWDNEMIAKAVQKPVGAVKALQHRGLNTLRRILVEEEASYESQ